MTPTKLDDALTGCSAEPIHIPGAIQPFGVLFALQGNGSTVSDLLVAQHSQNAGELMDAGARLVGRRIGDLFDLDSLRPIEARDFQTTEPVVVATRAAGAEHLWQAFVHRHRGQLILELERVSATPTRAPGLLSASMREGLQAIEAARSVVELCQRACETIKALTGLDGVMAYKFHEDEHGEVIAESKDAAFPQYLGLHYPASDIPRQARALFLDNWVRMIPDRDYRPVPIIGAAHDQPLDLGRASLAKRLTDPHRIPAQHGRMCFAHSLHSLRRETVGPVRRSSLQRPEAHSVRDARCLRNHRAHHVTAAATEISIRAIRALASAWRECAANWSRRCASPPTSLKDCLRAARRCKTWSIAQALRRCPKQDSG